MIVICTICNRSYDSEDYPFYHKHNPEKLCMRCSAEKLELKPGEWPPQPEPVSEPGSICPVCGSEEVYKMVNEVEKMGCLECSTRFAFKVEVRKWEIDGAGNIVLKVEEEESIEIIDPVENRWEILDF